MKSIWILLSMACLLCPVRLHADTVRKKTEITLKGHAIDAATREHMPYVRIAVRGTTALTLTDATGHYELKNLPAGDYTIEASYVGYKTVSRDVSLRQRGTQVVDFTLESSNIDLEGVVVTANRSETTRRMAPTLVSVAGAGLFENTQSNTLSQGMNFQPGVRVENNCQNCGFQQIRINGLDGPYTQILIDSRPVFSALAGVYGLEQLPASMIDRVEVMRGGGSALFGSSAIAGTINIITKEPLCNEGRVAHSTMGMGGLTAFDHNTSLNLSLVTDDHKAGIYIFGQNRERSGYDANGDGFTELPVISGQTLGFRSYLKTGLHSKLTFEYHNQQEYRRGGNMLNRPPHEADITEQVDHDIHSGGAKYDWFAPSAKQHLSVYASAQYVERESYYGGGQDPNAYGHTDDLTWVAGGQYVHSFDHLLFMPSDLTAGVEYNEDNLRDDAWGYDRHIRQDVRIGSAFVQNEWKNKQWGFLIGGRFDKHSLMDHLIFSPRATLRYNPTENINLRASYSHGFRAPQAFDEDLHIANVGGTVSLIELSKDLEEEKSRSYSLSGDVYFSRGDWQFNVLLEGFYTNLSDVFALRKLGVQDDVIRYERYNESGADVYGLTLEGKAAYRSLGQLQAGFTLQRSRYKEARSWSEEPSVRPDRRMLRSPDAYGYFTLTLTPVRPFSLSFSGTYTGRMLVGHVAGDDRVPVDVTVHTPDFFEMNLKAAYDFKVLKDITLQLNAGVQNLFDAYQTDFDRGRNRDSGYIYGPGLPRSYFAGIRLSY